MEMRKKHEVLIINWLLQNAGAHDVDIVTVLVKHYKLALCRYSLVAIVYSVVAFVVCFYGIYTRCHVNLKTTEALKLNKKRRKTSKMNEKLFLQTFIDFLIAKW